MSNAEVLNISNKAYQELPAMSFSGLKEFMKSPAHYKAWFESEDKPTASQRLGTAVHCAILEPHKFESHYRVVDGNRNANKVKDEIAAFEKEGYIVVKQKEYDSARHCRDAVYKHPVIKELLESGKPEQTILTTDKETGAPIKCRPDWYFREAGVVLDFKTFDDLTERNIEKQIKRMAYDLQAVHYLNVCSTDYGSKLRLFGNIFIEPEAPNGIRLVGIDDASLDAAFDRYSYYARLVDYKKCLETNYWPNYDTAPLTVNLLSY